MESHHAALRFAYMGWEVIVRLDGLTEDGFLKGRAEAKSGDQMTSHFELAGRHRSGSEAITELARTARAFVDTARRSHSGD